MTPDTLVQIWIAVTGLAAIALLQFGGETARRAAPFIGLAGQPAWFVAAIDAQQPGILLVTVAYAAVWLAGCVRVLAAAWGEVERF